MGVPVQIITPVNHKFELQLENLKPIFEADAVKDRNVVIVSVAGDFRKGKSFLLNFFLRYLEAQYKKHNVTDWIGESTNGAGMAGFKCAGGRNAITTGIWMWSEIFTHDYENGEKVAIILIDTQGIFDSHSNLMDNTTIFAISMMLSSVQCYNVLPHIQENDLQYLELFTEYGRLALDQTNEKAFQKLLFIVRDWSHESEIPFGDGQVLIDEKMAENADQTNDMKQLRRRINSSFDKVAGYLMPPPGSAVATGKNPNGNLSQMDPKFVDHLKILVPLIFAPENLIPKKINGNKIRVRDLVSYLQTYVNVFSSGTLPEPKTVLDATASTLLDILCTDCFNAYSEAMKKNIDEISRNENQPYYIPLELELVSKTVKANSLSQFEQRQKIGGQQLIQKSKTELIKEIDDKFTDFAKENDQRQKAFEVKVKADLRTLEVACLKMYDDKLQSSLHSTNPLSNDDLQQIHNTAKRDSLTKFNNERKFGSDEIIENFQDRIENQISLLYARYERNNDATRQAIKEMKNNSEAEKAAALEKLKCENLQARNKEREAESNNSILLGGFVKALEVVAMTLLNRNGVSLNRSQMDQIHENATNEAAMTERCSIVDRISTWVPTSRAAPLPDGAILAGHDQDGTQIYVGRARHSGDLIPAKVIPSKQAAYIAYGGQEILKDEFEVLCYGNVTWVKSLPSTRTVPPFSVTGGTTSEGELLYIARAYHDGALTVGKLQISHGALYIPFGGGEVPIHSEVEVLVEN